MLLHCRVFVHWVSCCLQGCSFGGHCAYPFYVLVVVLAWTEVQRVVNFSSSELSSHQKAVGTSGGLSFQAVLSSIFWVKVSGTFSPSLFPMSFTTGTIAICGTPTAKGPYANSVYVLIHYAFGSVRVAGIFCVCTLHFDHRVEQACSAAARVSSSLPIPGRSLLLPLAVLCFLVRGDTSCRVRCPRARSRLGPLSLLHWLFSSLLCSPIRGVYFFRGRRMWLSRLRSTSSLCIVSCTSSFFCVRVPPGQSLLGRSDVFPERVCRLLLGPYTLAPLCRLSLQDRTTTSGAAGRVSRP